MSSVSWLNVGDEAVASRWWNNLLHKRRLPSLDPNLRILKEPVAWFALAAVTSFIIGYFLTPTGIALGVGLLALVALGVLYPYLAVRATKLELRFSDTLCDEGSETLLVVTMRNYCPWPVIGLSIDHLFDLPERENTFRDAAFTLTRFDSVRDGEGSEFEASSRIALPALPGFGRTTLRIPMRFAMRGIYPKSHTQVTCCFPLAIWTARRACSPAGFITVEPKRVRSCTKLTRLSDPTADAGCSRHAGGTGDTLGVRDYRAGDLMRSIHWAQTARMDSLVVCERSQAEQNRWEIWLDARTPDTFNRNQLQQWRTHLAWRVRMAASFAEECQRAHLPLNVVVYDGDDSVTTQVANSAGRWRERLTLLPIDGFKCSSLSTAHRRQKLMAGSRRLCIGLPDNFSADAIGHNTRVQLKVEQATNSRRSIGVAYIDVANDCDIDIANQWSAWMRGLQHA